MKKRFGLLLLLLFIFFVAYLSFGSTERYSKEQNELVRDNLTKKTTKPESLPAVTDTITNKDYIARTDSLAAISLERLQTVIDEKESMDVDRFKENSAKDYLLRSQENFLKNPTRGNAKTVYNAIYGADNACARGTDNIRWHKEIRN